MPNMLKNRKRLLLIIQIVIAIVPIAWIFHKIDFGEMIEVLRNTPWWTLPALTTVAFFSLILQGIRWYVLMSGSDSGLRFSTAMYAHLTGAFYSLVLPSNLSQDVVRTVMVSRKHGYSKSWGATWIAKLINLATSVLFSLFGFFILDLTSIRSTLPAIAISISLLLILFIISFSKRITKKFRSVFMKILPQRLLRILENIREEIYLFKDKKINLLWCTGLTFLTHILLILNAIILISVVTGRICIAESFAFIPIIELLALAFAFTPNGFGIREMLAYAMFAYIGFTNEQLAGYIILGYVSVLIKLAGGIPLLIKKLPVKLKSSPAG
ncbi:MAG: flippase-like domain-containing protein [Fibrobacter sp.]|nr:flippase-like domain-containing protein [Fibrobacter sp.]